MPSPIGHALGGIAAGAAVSGRAGWASLALFAAAGAAPDIDFLLPIPHRAPTHSLASAVLVWLVAWAALAWRRPSAARGPSALRVALAVAAAWGSHALLDWLGADSSAPRGVMALWPLMTSYYVSGLDVFDNVTRRYWLPGFWRANSLAIMREIILVGPVAAVMGWRARFDRQRRVQPQRRRSPAE